MQIPNSRVPNSRITTNSRDKEQDARGWTYRFEDHCAQQEHRTGRCSRKAAYDDGASTGTFVCVLNLFASHCHLNCVVSQAFTQSHSLQWGTRFVCCLESVAWCDSCIWVLVEGRGPTWVRGKFVAVFCRWHWKMPKADIAVKLSLVPSLSCSHSHFVLSLVPHSCSDSYAGSCALNRALTPVLPLAMWYVSCGWCCDIKYNKKKLRFRWLMSTVWLLALDIHVWCKWMWL